MRDADSPMTSAVSDGLQSNGPSVSPASLLVVGAAAGPGRWLTEHLLSRQEWDTAVLIDTDRASAQLADVAKAFDGAVVQAVVSRDHHTTEVRNLASGRRVDLAIDNLRVIIAVPRDALGSTCDWLNRGLSASASIGVVSPTFASTLPEVAHRTRKTSVFGVHPLLDTSARSIDGQTVLLVPHATCEALAHGWLADLVTHSGGIARSISPERHDHIMSYVQAFTHQTLFAFMQGIVASGLDFNDVWEYRTPVFESLFGLAARAISQGRETVAAEIQTSLDGSRVSTELQQAVDHVAAVIGGRSAGPIEEMLHNVRDVFSGTLFDTVQATAATALAAAQSKRAELSRRRRTGSLVGLRSIGRPESLRVGRIRDVTPGSVTLEELMVGQQGHATLLDGRGRRNAARVGMNGQPRQTVFSLGHVELVLGADLEEAFDGWLAHIRRDVRFLVPESVAGAGVLAVVAGQRGIRDTELVSEVVRTGQRSVVVRMWIRADHDVDEMVERLRAVVDETYRWPLGLSLPVRQQHRLHYLGPSGTFSETAARQAAESVGLLGAALIACDDFDAVLAGTAVGDLAVLPISSSASGLVHRAATAVLKHAGNLEIGGVVDVAVRFDAYVRADSTRTDFRGSRVYSHPQALAQCQNFVTRWNLEPVECSSTTEALRIVASDDSGALALAGADKGRDFGLRVNERDVDDLSGSITRFMILGGGPVFDELIGGSDPTLRSIWIARSITDLAPCLSPAEGSFDEFLTAPDGTCLWVTSRTTVRPVSDARFLGRAPWSPRTPVVRADSAVPGTRPQ